jgi:predicted  nucleic acid-binding Zn-ribbon protein
MEKNAMEIKEAIVSALKEYIFPELQDIKREQKELKGDIKELRGEVKAISTRLGEHNAHLIDQSRRIDELRAEITLKIDGLRIEITQNIREVKSELSGRMDKFDGRMDKFDIQLDKVNEKIDKIHIDLIMRNDETNRAIARLYEVIVRKDEHQLVMDRVARLEQKMEGLLERKAA